jgi:phenylpropionate dioxygenase-like ring-hydroxylating dioxygenase large terminal subunit
MTRKSTDQMFDPANYAQVGLPLDHAVTLQPWCYTSEEFFRAEVDGIFMHAWNFFGRAERLPNPGDFFTVDFVGVPVLIVRDQQKRLRAFANTCRHRGTQLVCGEGNRRAFACPYHAWTYGLDGSLRGGRGIDDLPNFDKSENGLKEFRLETWGGFIFVNFDDHAESLADWLGDLPQQMASYDCENFVLCKSAEFDVACNWKSHIENSVEDYHVPHVHSYTLQQIQGGYEHFYPTTRGNWLVMRERHEGTRALLAEDSAYALPRIATVQGHAAEGTNFVCLFPCTLLAFTTDSMWYIELHPRGPWSTSLTVGMCFPKSSVERPDFAEKSAYYYKRWVKAVGEDNGITELQLRGLRSSFARQGRITDLEPLIPQMGRWWIDRVMRQHQAVATLVR